MAVYREEFYIETRGEADMIDITDKVREIVRRSGIKDGIVNVFCPGSTCAVSTIEYEPGLLKDFPRILERIAPRDIEYEHHKRWGDYNGHSHVRSALIKPSFTAPVVDGDVLLGTWQQITFIELDVRPRRRRIVVSVVG
ncbi:secondary thiamine-phosphate synthase enzyme [Candidatus Geothermarchaeota archaeon ex4572_27]|nr:MAG: secondary thiamine-phosphate synthase enzyme [Candidatus Geothermarchaeota archaeon ex4572_27]